MSVLHIVWYIIVGFVAGLLARAVLPGNDHMGMLATTGIGIVGSVVGGLLGHLISKPASDAKFHPAGLLMSIVGGVVVLGLLRFLG